jgi:hypothetical protein
MEWNDWETADREAVMMHHLEHDAASGLATYRTSRIIVLGRGSY